jgi:hypothetical protein
MSPYSSGGMPTSATGAAAAPSGGLAGLGVIVLLDDPGIGVSGWGVLHVYLCHDLSIMLGGWGVAVRGCPPLRLGCVSSAVTGAAA